MIESFFEREENVERVQQPLEDIEMKFRVEGTTIIGITDYLAGKPLKTNSPNYFHGSESRGELIASYLGRQLLEEQYLDS